MSPKVPKVVQRFMEGLVIESEAEVLEFVRGYLLKKMDPATPDSLIEAIKNNTSILPNLDQDKYKKVMRRVLSTKVARVMWEKEKHRVNDALILKWLIEDRPDLASIIVNWPGQEARVWLHNQVEQIKKDFLGIS